MDRAASIALRLATRLTEMQSRIVKEWDALRDKGLLFGEFPYDQKGRAYFPLKETEARTAPPAEMAEILDRAGYVVPDYRDGRAFKKGVPVED